MKNCLNSQEISERQHQLKHVNVHNGCAHSILGQKAERVGRFGDRGFFYVGYILQ